MIIYPTASWLTGAVPLTSVVPGALPPDARWCYAHDCWHSAASFTAVCRTIPKDD